MMSPAERKFWLVAQRRVAGMQPDVQSALLRAFAIIRDSMSEADLARLIDTGQLEQLIRQVFDDTTLDRAFIPYRQKIRQATERGFQYAVPSLPKGGTVDGTVAVMFDHLSPDVIAAVRTMESKAIDALKEDIRDVVRAYIEQGIREGVNPRETARSLRDVIGLSPTQQQNLTAFEAKQRVEHPDWPEDRLAKAVASYRKRAISLNAETNARTATLDAYKNGQQLAWQQAKDNGVIPADAELERTWHGVMDDRERPEHVAMEGETAPFGQPYSNGQMTPGDTDFNCRCIEIIRARISA